MNIIPSLKTLPLISAIAFGLALSPTLSMAADGNRGDHKMKYSHDRGQSHKNGHGRHKTGKSQRNSPVAHAVNKHRQEKQGHKHRSNNHYDRAYGNHMYHKHGNHGHNHAYSDHNHTNYVYHDYGYRGQYVDLDNMRFMLGLHTGNFDIIFRD